MLVEVIVTNVKEAILAEEYGANRLELIHAFADGGLSPALSLTTEVCSAVNIPVSVMVRPHAKSFVYSDGDMQQILTEIDYIAEKSKAANIVFGSLDGSGDIDFKQLERVLGFIELAKLGLTFHRAIDVCNNTLKSFGELQQYAGTNLKRVLSSGGKATAELGVEELSQMQQLVKPSGVKLLIGSGVTPSNAQVLSCKIGVDEIHIGTGVRDSNGLLSKLKFAELIQNIK
jgi:copper homeostasis protein